MNVTDDQIFREMAEILGDWSNNKKGDTDTIIHILRLVRLREQHAAEIQAANEREARARKRREEYFSTGKVGPPKKDA